MPDLNDPTSRLFARVILLLLPLGWFSADAARTVAASPMPSSMSEDGFKGFTDGWGPRRKFDISSDGTHIAYVLDVGAGSIWASEMQKRQGKPTIWVKDLVRDRLLQLPGVATIMHSGWPSWSPDGSRLAYVAADSRTSPFRLHVWERSSGRHRVYEDREADRSPYDLQWSPDGRTVYFQARRSDTWLEPSLEALEGKQAKLDLPMSEMEKEDFLKSSIGRLLFQDPENDGRTVLESPVHAARAAPGKSATDDLFYGRRTDIVAVDVDSGQARTVFTGNGVRNLKLAPDGRSLMILADVPADTTPRANNSIQMLVDIYVIPVVSGAPVARMQASNEATARDAQGRAVAPMVKDARFWLFHDESWAPTSDRIVYAEQGSITQGDLMVIDVRTGRQRNLTAALKLPEDARDVASGRNRHDFHGKFSDDNIAPAWSRDGKTLYVRRMRPVSRTLDRYGMRGELWAVSAASGEARNLTPDVDFSVEAVLQDNGRAWTGQVAQADELLLAVRFGGDNASGVLRFEPGTGKSETIARFQGTATRPGPGGRPYYAVASAASTLVITNQRADAPLELYSIDVGNGKVAQATQVNRVFAGRDIPEGRLVTWTAADGAQAGGMLYLPPRKARPSGTTRFPIVVEIYPGNAAELESIRDQRFVGQMYFGDSANVVRRQLWDAGYAILLADVPFVGEGRACREIAANTVAGLDAAGATGLVDLSRAGVIGTSFGGYAVNCVVTHSTRFNAAVSMAGNSDLVGVYLHQGGGQGGQAKLGGPFPAALDRYIADSPIFHVDKVETPLLLLHGKTDFAVRFPQSVAMFRGLELLGKAAKLVGYDGLGHGISQHPDVPIQAQAWFDRYLKFSDAQKVRDSRR